jgi:outer membrane protein TolC
MGWSRPALGAEVIPITYEQCLARASRAAPSLAVARSQEAVAASEIGMAGVYPNPVFFAGTSTQTARLSLGASIPLSVLGQRGAAQAASRAELETTRIETQVSENDVRAAAAHSFVALWFAERTARARTNARDVGRQIEAAVQARVELGAAPQLDGMRVHAEQLRAEADAAEAERLVDAAAVGLGRWLAMPSATQLRTAGDPVVPERLPPLAQATSSVDAAPSIRREQADAHAADLRAARERAWVRPMMSLDFGVDAYDPTLPATNYRVQLGIEVPLFNQRGPNIEREQRAAAVARNRALAEQGRMTAEMTAAYRSFEAIDARRQALASGVVPAAESAAKATRESYELGRATLEAVLNSERSRIDANLTLLEATAARAHAWIDYLHATGAL